MPAERPSPPRTRARGRPRSESARRAVLDAARTLFARGGYPAATVEGIAARSGVAKTTIYRWWANRAALLVDLLLEASANVAPPSARDPMRALRGELQRVARAADALPGRLLQSLLGEALRDPELRAALQHGLFQPRHAAPRAAGGSAAAFPRRSRWISCTGRSSIADSSGRSPLRRDTSSRCSSTAWPDWEPAGPACGPHAPGRARPHAARGARARPSAAP